MINPLPGTYHVGIIVVVKCSVWTKPETPAARFEKPSSGESLDTDSSLADDTPVPSGSKKIVDFKNYRRQKRAVVYFSCRRQPGVVIRQAQVRPATMVAAEL